MVVILMIDFLPKEMLELGSRVPCIKVSTENEETVQIFAQHPRQDSYKTTLDTRAWVFQEDVLLSGP